MTERYHQGSRQLQDRHDTRRLADRLVEKVHSDALGPGERAFLARMSMFFLATADADGQPQCSYKGGDPGFVRVLDDRTLCFPVYDGNGMYLSLGNLQVNPKVGMLFIDFESPSRWRIEGTATLDEDDPLAATWPEAQFVVRVRATRVFPNCPRYIHRMALVERSPYVPRAGCVTPVPEWKRGALATGVLPAGDPAAGAADG
jgi:predicted pyridoxine 5'-phosphate oxidase superfamily flavin-nucleotide-binding protein